MFVQSLIDPCGIKTDILLIYIGMRNRTLYNYTINKNDKNYLSSYIYRLIAWPLKLKHFNFWKDIFANEC